MQSYMIAAARCQQTWLKTCVARRPVGDSYRRSDIEDSPDMHCAVLEAYIRMIPYLIPEDEELATPVLWHPDSSSSNIMVSASEPYGFTGIIDWQTACAAPLVLQCSFPPAFDFQYAIIEYPDGATLPTAPEEYHTLPPDMKASADHELYAAFLQKGVEIGLGQKNAPYRMAMACEQRGALQWLTSNVDDTWYTGFPLFRETLRVLDKRLRASNPAYDLPPVVPEDEMEEHEKLVSTVRSYVKECVRVQDTLGTVGELVVHPDDYDEKMQLLKDTKASWDITKGPWPFHDGVWSRELD